MNAHELLNIREAVQTGCEAICFITNVTWSELPRDVQNEIHDQVFAVLEASYPVLQRQTSIPLYQEMQEASVELTGEPLFVCCLCLEHKSSKSEDGRLTVINGMMLCVDHANYIGGPIAEVDAHDRSLHKWLNNRRNS